MNDSLKPARCARFFRLADELRQRAERLPRLLPHQKVLLDAALAIIHDNAWALAIACDFAADLFKKFEGNEMNASIDSGTHGRVADALKEAGIEPTREAVEAVYLRALLFRQKSELRVSR